VVAKGSRVRRFKAGDRVYAYAYENSNGGFYAEYIAVDQDHVSLAPKRLDLLEAGAAAATGLTAQQGIDHVLRVRKGETVLVFGASGAVGTLAVQFARRRGARVLGTASRRDAALLIRGLSGSDVLDARSERAPDRLRTLAPDGLHAVLALAGGDALERCLDWLRPNGRVAYPNGVDAPQRRRGIPMTAYDGEVGSREFARLERAIGEARLRVPIAAVFPLAQAAKAHARLERGHVLGRIVLRIKQDRR
jgi:NADPH2:quinone reductase